MRRHAWLGLIVLGAAAAVLAGCASPRPLPPVPKVDVDRFLGDWYVIAHIPSWPERDAFNAVESYARKPDGRIQTTFRFRRGSFEAPEKTMHPVGTVQPGTNGAIWGMQFVWPIQAEYVIAYLNEAYTQTIVGRSKRDYVWIMARTPTISEADYAALVTRVGAMGYDIGELRRVPQQWPAPGR